MDLKRGKTNNVFSGLRSSIKNRSEKYNFLLTFIIFQKN